MRTLGLALALYRGVIGRAPAAFRDRYADEMAAALASLLDAERRQRGHAAAARLWIRAMADAVRVVRIERVCERRPRGAWRMGLFDDVVFVGRTWRRSPGFALTAIGTVALGLGLNAGLFAFADGFLFRPLPFDEPDGLVSVRSTGTFSGGLALDDYDAIRARDGAGVIEFAHWDPANQIGDLIEIDGSWSRVRAFEVSPQFAEVMGFRLVLGRPFHGGDHRAQGTRPAWLGHRFWRQRLGGDPNVLGRRFRTSGWRDDAIEVVGVLPASISTFDLNNAPPDVVVPAWPAPPVPARRRALATELPLGRLRPGVSLEQARDRLQAVIDGVPPSAEPGAAKRRIRLTPLREALVWGGRPTATLLFVVALAVLVIVALNVAHLFLVQAATRTHEIGVRLALGASRWRIARLLLTGSVAVCAVGLAAGLTLGSWLSHIVAARVPIYPTKGRNLSMVPMGFDDRVIIFTAGLALLLAVTAGLAPLVRHARGQSTLARASRGGVGVGRWVSACTLAGEVAVASVVIGATLTLGLSVWRLLSPPLGFDWSDLHVASLDLPRPESVGGAPSGRWRLEISDALAQVPGVTTVAYGPWLTAGPSEPVERNGRPLRAIASALRVDHEYLDAFRIALVAGRIFTEAESRTDGEVAIVDEAVARLVWPGANPIGETVDVGGKPRTVVGVAAHVRRTLADSVGGPVYVPPAAVVQGNLTFWLRAQGMPAPDVNRLASDALRRVVPDSRPVVQTVTRQLLFFRQAEDAAFQGPIVAALGALALVLVGVGLFGIVSYVAEQRLREFGIRSALGARPADLYATVVRQSAAPVLAGLGLGLAASLWVTGWLRSIVQGMDAGTMEGLILTSASIGVVAVIAIARPARRASRIDPVTVLRAD